MIKRLLLLIYLFGSSHFMIFAQDCIGPVDNSLTLITKNNFGGPDCLFTVRFCIKKTSSDANTVDYYVSHTYGTLTRTINVSSLHVGSVICEHFTFVADCNSTASFLAEGKRTNNTVCGVVSDFIILPIKLISFQAFKEKNNSVTLNWKTAVEENSSHFVIQQAHDPTSFRDVGKVAAAGNSNQLKDYKYSIAGSSPTGNTSTGNYFRLKMVDKDGQFTFSDVVSVSKISTKVSLGPNPVSNVISLNNFTHSGISKLIITDLFGKTTSLDVLDNKVDVSNLKPGTYFIEIEQEKLKFIKI